MIKRNLVIFDWDGTIENSVINIISSMNVAARELGLEEPLENDIRNIIGLSLRDAVQILFPNLQVLEIESLIKHYRVCYRMAQEMEWNLFENVEATLNSMKDSNYLLAVATGKSRDGLDRSLRLSGLADLIDISITADETASKPSPQMLVELLNHFDIPPTAALMVGDSKYDLEMAQNVPMASIGMTYGVHERCTLIKHSPIACLDEFEEIQFHVDRYFAEKTK
jgi:phosphoglycolate phosphatase